MVLGESSPDPFHLHESSQLHAILKRCASQLSETLKQVYNLYITDQSQQEIAQSLEIKLGTVKSRTSEMIRKLGECVHPQRGNQGRS
jgi:DNA-directed RNA polymerase specialized sigma24 family protein